MTDMGCEIRSYIGTRNRQEDSAGYAETEKGLFCAVCDGIGSRKDGAASSQLAVSRFLELYKEGFTGGFPSFITDAAEKIDRNVYENYGNACGTTAVVVYVNDNKLWWFSVGDSRLYIFRKGKLKQITKDHDYAYVLELRLKKNIIDKEGYEAEKHKGDRLASFIGMGGIDIADVSMEPLMLEKGDMLLLTSDGLYKSIGDERIAGILYANSGSAAEAADSLMTAVKGFDGAVDNTTFAVIN